jgi:type VI secretion system secreted protein VgrG
MNDTALYRTLRLGDTQYNRLIKLDTPLGPNVLLPHRAKGRSRLGRHFEFTVDAVSTQDDIELKKLIAQPVTLWIQQTDGTYAPHHGYVFAARRLGSDSALTHYQIVFASYLNFLKFRRDQRIWQDRPVDAIVTDVLNRHPQAQGHFQFKLFRPLPARSFCMQYEDDWNFVHRLLESEGLYGFWEQAPDGKSHTLIVTDRLDTLSPLSPPTVRFYRSDASSETDALVQFAGTRTLQSFARTTRTFDYKNPSSPHNPKATSMPTIGNQGDLPEQLEVYEYTGAYTYLEQSRGDQLSKLWMEERESRAKRFHGVGGVRSVDAGRTFELIDHPEHDRDPAAQREFAVIETEWLVKNNLPVSDRHANFPQSLREEIDGIEHASAGADAVRHPDGSEGFFQVRIDVQRTAVPFRSPFEHRKPEMHLQTAIVATPSGEEVFTDELNRAKVRFHWDRLNDGDERASCWLRSASSDTGSGYGAVFSHRNGEEVLVDFVGGDCDRPIIVGKLYNGATQPQWHSNGILSGYRSKEYSGAGFNQMVFDDATAQNRAQLYSSQANTHLHLGYLIQHTGNTRGEYLGSGFDLRSDAYGAVRASRGLYVTTHPKQASSQPLDVRESQQQLVNAESVVESLSGASEQHHAETLKLGYDALKKFSDATQDSVAGDASSGGRTAGGGVGSANAFKEPVMLFGSPAGIALSTQQSTHIAADQHVNLVSGQSTHIASGKSLIASVADKLSLFVQNAGMKLFAAKGKVEVQAHSDNAEITAQKTVKILSATENVEAAAKQEILLTSGGAYIRIKGGNIEIHAPGKIDFKGAEHLFGGPASMPYPLPMLPGGTCKECLLNAHSGRESMVEVD